MPNRNAPQHAREVLATVDPEFQLVEAYRSYLESSPREASGRRKENSLRSWCLARVKEISGSTSLQDALSNPDVRTLLAFG